MCSFERGEMLLRPWRGPFDALSRSRSAPLGRVGRYPSSPSLPGSHFPRIPKNLHPPPGCRTLCFEVIL